MITNEDIIYNHKLLNLEYIEWSTYIFELDKYKDNYIFELFKELDCCRYNKYGQPLMSINNYEYPIILTKIIKVLDNINNYSYYNYLFGILCNIHTNNLAENEIQSRNKFDDGKTKKKDKKVKKTKTKNEYVRSVSTDLFTGKPKYIYSNLKTGDEIISDNPDLLEELNKPKEKKKKDKTPKVLSLPIGFTFKVNK